MHDARIYFSNFQSKFELLPIHVQDINQGRKLNNLELISSTYLSIVIDNETRICECVLAIPENMKEVIQNG
jgi:hypothetical protein